MRPCGKGWLDHRRETRLALLKRQIYGIHHWVSVKHLDQYVSEAAWRYMLRERVDGARVTTLLAQTDGRLTYKALIGRA